MSPESSKLLLDLFHRAESKVKNAEQISNTGLTIPSINELRYAGYHIVKAINSDDETSEEKMAQDAINHIKRAIYDIDEALLVFYLESVAVFKDKCGDSAFVDKVIPDYLSYLTELIPFSRSNDMNIVPIIVLPMFIKNLSHSLSSNGDFL